MTPADKARYERVSRLNLLFHNWTATRQSREAAHTRRAELESKGLFKISILNRMERWLEQIGTLERKERDILGEIDAIEKRHRQMRKDRKLRRAQPSSEVEKNAAPAPERKQARTPWWILFYLLILSDRPKKQ